MNNQIEQKKQLYIMIRRIHLLEMVFNFDWISKQEYDAEIVGLVQKYLNLRSMMKSSNPPFDMVKFVRDFNIGEEAKIVDIVCQRNPDGSGGAKKNDLVLFMEATATFIKVNDVLAFNQSKPIVIEIRPVLGELVFLMRKLKSKLSKDFAAKVGELERQQHRDRLSYSMLESKNAEELLSEAEFKEFQVEISALYRMMELDAQSR